MLRLLENRALRRIFGSKWEEVTGDRSQVHNENLQQDFYCSPDNIQVTNKKIIGWAGHVARMEEWRNAKGVLVGKPKERKYSEGLGIDGNIILSLI
jgi:hypothetical protein